MKKLDLFPSYNVCCAFCSGRLGELIQSVSDSVNE